MSYPLRSSTTALMIGYIVALSGCGQSDISSHSESNEEQTSATAPTTSLSPSTSEANEASPAEIVRTFLDAVRCGNDGKAELMMTALARK